MKKETADRIEEVLSLAYGNRFNPGLVTVMEQRFNNEPDEAVEAAVGTCIGQCEFPPTIAEISKQMAAHRVAAAKEVQQEKYREEKSDLADRGSVKKTYVTAEWKKEWAEMRQRSDTCFQRARKHFRLNFLHPLISTRNKHQKVAIMIRKAIADRHDKAYTPEEIIAAVTESIRENDDVKDIESRSRVDHRRDSEPLLPVKYGEHRRRSGSRDLHEEGEGAGGMGEHGQDKSRPPSP